MLKIIKLFLFCILFLVLFISFSAFFLTRNKVHSVNSFETDKQVPVSTLSDLNLVEPNAIPDLMPVDVYLSMEKRGYKTKFYATDHFWASTKEFGNILDDDGVIYYLVEVHGPNTDSVHRVNVLISMTKKDPSAIALPELLFVASIPYNGADPQKAQEWVRQNIGKKSKIIIGGVTFEIDVPATTSRSLKIYVE